MNNLEQEKKLINKGELTALLKTLHSLDISSYSLEKLEDFLVKKIHYNTAYSASAFDILFQENSIDMPLVLVLVLTDEHRLFKNILIKYKDELSLLPKEKWDFMLYADKCTCHDIFLEQYGKNFFKDIDHATKNVLFYSEEHYKNYYLSGELDIFYKLENIKYFTPNITPYLKSSMIHVLNFFEKDKDGFKNLIINHNEKYQDILRTEPTGLISLTDKMILKLPSKKEVNLLIERWGIEKTSEVISEFINFQKEQFLASKNKNSLPPKFETDKMVELISSGINFINCGSALVLGVRKDLDLLSYFIINGVITNKDLLENIENPEIQAQAHHDSLNKSISNKAEPNIKRPKI